jgi:hypothetical protein
MVGGLLPPQVLEHRCRELLGQLEIGEAPADSAWGYDFDPRAAPQFAAARPAEMAEMLRSDRPPPLRFWYRQSRAPMSPWRGSLPGLRIGDVVTPDDPPLTDPGMVLVRLGPRGRLLELRRVPDHGLERSRDAAPAAAVVTALLHAVGAVEGRAVPSRPGGPMPMPGPLSLAWTAPDELGGGEIRVEATFSAARPTWVRAAFPAPTPGDVVTPHGTRSRGHPLGAVFFVFLAVGAVIAVRNVRGGRWDRRGALRLAVAAFVLCCVSSLLFSHHTMTAAEEARRLFSSVAYGATRALMTWLLYVAVEPIIRRLDPGSLVSWSRLLSGRVSDPAVGRDVLIGLAATAVQLVAMGLWFLARGWEGAGPQAAALAGGQMALTGRSALDVVLRLPVVVLGYSIPIILGYALLRAAIGRVRWAAPIGLWLLTWMLYASVIPTAPHPVDRAAVAVIIATCLSVLVVRFGLLATSVSVALAGTLSVMVITVRPGDWYFGPTAVTGGVVLGLIVFGVRTATGSTSRRRQVLHSG